MAGSTSTGSIATFRATALLLAGLMLVPAATAQSLSIRADYWFPVNGYPDGERQGFAIDLLRAIFEPVGISVDYRLSSWSRSLEMVRNGQTDCVVGAYLSDAPELQFPHTAFAIDDIAFYVRAGSPWRYSGTRSLDPLTIGVIADYSYGAAVDAYLESQRGAPRIEYLHGQEPLQRNVQKLLAGRVDVLIESPLVMESLLGSREGQPQVIEAGRIGINERVYLACSPAKAATGRVLELFDDGMQKLQENGELERIMRSYGLAPSVYRWQLLRENP